MNGEGTDCAGGGGGGGEGCEGLWGQLGSASATLEYYALELDLKKTTVTDRLVLTHLESHHSLLEFCTQTH